MSERRVLARGTIRVDARRARAKLREHLLLDLAGYSRELARAAIAFGAKQLNVWWDADEVSFALDAPPIPGERLARLLDFALDQHDGAGASPLQSLALGVNAALGLDVDAVTVTCTRGTEAWSVRYTPELLTDESAELPQVTTGRAPKGAFAEGVLVHVKRKLGLGVLRRALSDSPPREVALLIESTRESPLLLTCQGSTVDRGAPSPVLARVPLTLPSARRAVVELHAVGAPCQLDVLERGVLLVSRGWVPLAGLAAEGELCAPVRVVVDADELPTNASRSALREDSPLARELDLAAEAGFRKLLAAVMARVSGVQEPDGVEIAPESDAALRDAVGLLVCLAVRSVRAKAPLDPDARALLELPLFDAPGGQRLSAGRVLSAHPIWVWRSKEALPDELSPWLGGVVWLRGHLVERLLEDVDVQEATDLVERARAGAARRARFEAHPPAEPRVPAGQGQLARQRFSLTAGAATGLTGEVVLLAPLPGGAHRPSLLRVFIDGRLLEALPIEPSVCPLAFDAAIAWPGVLRPRFDFDGVERDQSLALAAHAASDLCIGLADQAAERMGTLPPSERELLERMLRNAVMAYSTVPKRLGLGVASATGFRERFTRLFRASIYPTTAGQTVSIEALSAYGLRTGALSVVSRVPDAPLERFPDGRPVVIASAAEVEALCAAIPRPVERVPYDRFVGSTADSPARRETLLAAVDAERTRQGLSPRSGVLVLERGHSLVVAAPAYFGVEIEHHLGVPLARKPRKQELSTVVIATDDLRTVPTATLDGVRWKPSRTAAWLEDQFLERLVSALEGDPEARQELSLDPEHHADPAIAACLLANAVRLRHRRARRGKSASSDDNAKREALLERVEGLAILAALDPDGTPQATSIAAVEARHGDGPPLLERAPGFPTGDWLPVLSRSERERGLLTARFPKAASGAAELREREARARKELQRRAVLAMPVLDLEDLDTRRAEGDVVVLAPPLSDAAEDELEAAVALPNPALAPGVAWWSVRYHGRHCAGLEPSAVGLPVVGNVSSTREDDFVGLSAPSPQGVVRVGQVARRSAVALLEALVRESSLLGDPRALALCLALVAVGGGDDVERVLASPELRLPTVQGADAPLAALGDGARRLRFGTERFSTWLGRDARASDLDRPVLFLPPGDLGSLQGGLLQRLGFALEDVSGELSALQRKRGGGASAAPKLTGAPAHPSLRVSLWEVGVAAGDGELELVRGPASRVDVAPLNGRTETLDVELACPIRAVVRTDALEVSAIQRELLLELERALHQLLVRVSGELDQLPTFVRHSMRAYLANSAEGRAEPALAAAPVFEDTAGFWHSLGGLVSEGRWDFTTLDPPFSPRKQPTLRLSETEARSLGEGLELRSADHRIERERAGERRRTGPQVHSPVLAVEERVASVMTGSVNVEGTTGEVGLLAPGHGSDARGRLHVDRRPLCTFDLGEGWPLVASINDDGVEPDRYFEGPAKRGVLGELASRVRRAADATVRRTFDPGHVLAARWLWDEPVGALRVTGCLALGTRFPAAPKVRVYAGRDTTPLIRCLAANIQESVIGAGLPLEGDLLVRWVGGGSEGADAGAETSATTVDALESLPATWQALGELGERLAVELLAEARTSHGATPVLDEHALSLALVGLPVSVPVVTATDGRPLELQTVLAELSRSGTVWTSDGRGFVEGAFPSGPPPFFLPESSALARVLTTRAPLGALRALGDAEDALAAASQRLDVRPTALELPAAGSNAPERPNDTWWTRVTTALSDALSSAPPAAAMGAGHQALFDLLATLRLTGSPVENMIITRGRRALSFEPRPKRLCLNPKLAPLPTLLPDTGTERAALCVMAAHAVAEINRALVDVTDGEERRALVQLLEEL
jgi:hypothetical protein